MKNKDLVRLRHTLEAIELIENFTQKTKNIDEFSDDVMMQSAVIRQFEIIGACANVSDELKKNNPDIEWATIKGFRNLLVHEYFRVDVTEVWSTIEDDLPVLKKQIQSLLANN